MTYIGIDPGQTGGIAWIRDGKAAAEKMPETERDVLDLLSGIASEGPCIAILEKVHSMPGQGVSSTFAFGQGYGALKMALIALGIPHDHVTPQTWQKSMKCLTGGDKNVSKARAQELFPSIKVTHAKADALLMAEYARRQNL